MTVTFFGHRDAPACVRAVLKETLRILAENEGADLFYVGNEGAFDCMVQQALQQLRIEYPNIRCIEVLAYMPGEKKPDRARGFRETVYPEGLENTPRRYALSKRNQWMVERADTVITYVVHTVGGAAKWKELSEKKGKRVINLAPPEFSSYV